jgi:hypothetical protein
MPCPYFEPLQPVTGAETVSARLPLIQKYAGRCQCRPDTAHTASGDNCNQGYARGTCLYYPDRSNRANRYSLLSRSGEELQLLFISEAEYFPAGSRTLHFSISQNRLLEQDVEPSVAAQASAFCRSYLRQHYAAPNPTL